MGGRKTNSQPEVPAREPGVLKKRSSNARSSSADAGPDRIKTENKGRQSSLKPKASPQQTELAKMQSTYCMLILKVQSASKCGSPEDVCSTTGASGVTTSGILI